MDISYQTTFKIEHLDKLLRQLAWLEKSIYFAGETRNISLSLSLGLMTDDQDLAQTVKALIKKELVSADKISIGCFPVTTHQSLVHNELAKNAESDLLIFSKLGMLPMPPTIDRLLIAFEENPRLGICDGKQIPFEIPLDAGFLIPETSWCSGNFMMIRHESFSIVGGFDVNFSSDGEDVDLSWRIKKAGYSAYHIPSAVIYDTDVISRRLNNYKVENSVKFSPETRLLLAWKWSRDDVLAELIESFRVSENDETRSLAMQFNQQKENRGLPERMEDPSKIAIFETLSFTHAGSGVQQ